jgi:hypothetical protein
MDGMDIRPVFSQYLLDERPYALGDLRLEPLKA